MTLEDEVRQSLVSLGSSSLDLEQTKNKVDNGEKVSYSNQQFNVITQYQDGEVTPQEMQALSDLPDRTVTPILNRNLPNALKNINSHLEEIVGRNPDGVLEEIKGNELAYVVTSTKGVESGREEHDRIVEAHEDYLKWKDIAEKKDVNKYLDNIENPVLKELLPYVRQEELGSLMESRQSLEQMKFLRNFVSDNELDDDNNGLDDDKMRGYVRTNLSYANDEEQKEIYRALGKGYTLQLISESRQGNDSPENN